MPITVSAASSVAEARAEQHRGLEEVAEPQSEEQRAQEVRARRPVPSTIASASSSSSDGVSSERTPTRSA